MSDPKIHPKGGGPTRNTTLPTEAAERKSYPVATGFLDYFPDAVAAIAHLSWKGNQQHNPGEETYWNRAKSSDEADTAMRHFLQRGTLDEDGVRHSVKACWRMLAFLQKEIEDEQKVDERPRIAVDHRCLATKQKYLTNGCWSNAPEWAHGPCEGDFRAEMGMCERHANTYFPKGSGL